jgi:hypothetical protein
MLTCHNLTINTLGTKMTASAPCPDPGSWVFLELQNAPVIAANDAGAADYVGVDMPQLRPRNRHALGGQEVGKRATDSPPDDVVRQRAIYEALGDLGEVIYALACPDGLIKIGHTSNLMDRRRQHRAAFEDIIAVLPGSYDDEQLIHNSLRDHVARGREYYHPTFDVLAFVNEIRDRAGIPPYAPA